MVSCFQSYLYREWYWVLTKVFKTIQLDRGSNILGKYKDILIGSNRKLLSSFIQLRKRTSLICVMLSSLLILLVYGMKLSSDQGIPGSSIESYWYMEWNWVQTKEFKAVRLVLGSKTPGRHKVTITLELQRKWSFIFFILMMIFVEKEET